jgi:DNA-binding response OmpR family regulator
MSRKILVVEDNKDLARLLELHLRDLTYDVDLTFDGDAGWTQITSQPYDLIILDLMLPGIDGLEICRRIRSRPAYTPILMLTSKSTELDRVLGLEIGADDYVTKPFSIRELMARIEALLRRTTDAMEAKAAFSFGPWSVDADNQRAVQQGKETAELTSREFSILELLHRYRGRIVGRRVLLREVWGFDEPDEIETRTVDVHIGKLRKKLRAEENLIQTVRGAGYRYNG